jgi:hypothetical protein
MFKTSHLHLFLFFAILTTNATAQNLQDSLASLYAKYLNLNERTNKLDSLDQNMNSLRTQYVNFDAILRSNNESLKRITNAQLFSFDRSIKQNRTKIINTADFIRSANTSLNALQVASTLSNYLDDVSQLNNPTNSELGFALTDEIIKIVEKSVIPKIHSKASKAKFVGIVREIMNSPVTTSFAKSVPIAGSIKGVIDLVVNLSANDKNDISVEDIGQLKRDLRKYLEHYEGLEQANQQFTSNLNTLNVRMDALKLILRNYAIERLRPLTPPSVQLDTFRNLTLLVNRHTEKSDVQAKVDAIIDECKVNNVMNYEKALSDRRLAYPEQAVNQAQVIHDELVNLQKSFLSNLNTYQRNIETVLNNSKANKLGDAAKIDRKATALQKQLGDVSEALRNGINLEDLREKLQRISAL